MCLCELVLRVSGVQSVLEPLREVLVRLPLALLEVSHAPEPVTFPALQSAEAATV